MKIVSYELGQIVYLVPAEEVRPPHHIDVRDVIAKLMTVTVCFWNRLSV